MFSNAYIFRFSTIMVVLVAAMLASAALFLKPYQERNLQVEKMKDILSAANIKSTAEDAVAIYKERIKEEILVDFEGNINSIYSNGQFVQGDKKAFDVDMPILMKEIEDYKLKKGTVSPLLPIFHMVSEQGTDIFVVPVRGKGLWGPIWGHIAFDTDMNTIVGATFDHKGETPGLGAEINQDFFEHQFIGKKIFDENNEFKSITVVKGGVENSTTVKPLHGVDAISGGTITSNGVSDMLRDCLNNYIMYFQKIKAAV